SADALEPASGDGDPRHQLQGAALRDQGSRARQSVVMADEPFVQEDFRVLTPEAFDFVLNNELKRAVRSQNFLTLVVVDPRAEGRTRQEAAREIAQLVSREVRETDLLSATPEGRLSMVLLDA